MSWCGGGEINPTPGVECRTRAMMASTLWPGSCPPSPGFAPCAILICRTSALTRYSVVTPKRPDATCLIAERIESPFGNGLKREASSPPSPVFDLPPMRFIAIAKVVCASRLIEPKLIAPVAKRRTMLAVGSTSSSGIGSSAGLNSIRPRVVSSRSLWSLMVFAEALLSAGEVALAAQPEGVIAAEIKHLAIERIVAEGARVPHQRFLGDRGEIGPLDRRRGAGEVFLDEVAFQSDRVEDLRAAIGLISRDAHLGHDLEKALAERLRVILLHLLGAQGQPVFGADLFQRREGEIGVDRLGAITCQYAEMVHLARLAGLDDNAGLGAQPLADQMVVHRRGGEQCRDRHALDRHRAVGQDQDVVASLDRRGRFAAQPVERRRDAGSALGGRPGDIERVGFEAAVDQPLDAADL